MPLLLTKIPDAKLVIVGDGPSRLELEELAKTLNVRDAVIFTGMQPWSSIGRMYQLGDVFVSASVTETQGLTFAEAMAAALPVVAMEDESIAGFVRDGYNGHLFHNEEELANKLAKILSDQAYRQILSENAIHSIKPLSAETFGHNAEAFYHEILQIYHGTHVPITHKKTFKLPFTKNKKNKNEPL